MKLDPRILTNVVVVIAQLSLFYVGYFVSCQGMFDCAASGCYQWWVIPFCHALAMISFTPNNIFLLAILSCYVGASVNDTDYTYDKQWRMAIARGGMIFGVFMGQQAYMELEKIVHSDPITWCKLAIEIMVLSAAAGFEPVKMTTILQGMKEKKDAKPLT